MGQPSKRVTQSIQKGASQAPQDESAALVLRVQAACEGLRSSIELLNDPKMKRRDLAVSLGGVLKGLEAGVYATVGDEKVQVSAVSAPGAGAQATQSEMMRIALAEAPPMTVKAVARESVLPRLSDEQKDAARAAETEGVVKVEARAGSGKTFFLVGVSETLKGRGTYVAYNRDIQRDASERFPKHVLVRTIHALAYAAVASSYTSRNKPVRDYQQKEVIDLLGLHGEGSASIAYAARETLTSFLTTLDDRVNQAHVPATIRLRINRSLRKLGKGPEEALAEVERRCGSIARHAQQLWEISREESGRGALPHDGYLKIWLERGARIDTNYLLIDEAQDMTPVMKAIFDRQDCRKVYVGDRYQSIYGYRGAINAMEQIVAPTKYLTQSYRFGRNIATVANWLLELRGEEHKIQGVALATGVVGPVDKNKPYTILARTNAGLCARAAEVALTSKASVVGGTAEMTALMKSAYGLYTGRRDQITHPLLAGFESFTVLRDYAEASSDKECGMMVRMLEDHGAGLDRIINALSTKLVPDSEAQVILSTAHKAKGREWGQVLIEDDFQDLYDGNQKLRPEEANLLHVAATRARLVLQPNSRLEALNPTVRIKPLHDGEDGTLNLERKA